MSTVPGRFGPYGGRYVPETLIPALDALAEAWASARVDPAFRARLADDLRDWAGRPTPLTFAARLTAELGGAEVWLKREDLLHTGAHKVNNTVGQVLLALRMGKTRVIAETGAGQHGVATAAACARVGLPCEVKPPSTLPSAGMVRCLLDVAAAIRAARSGTCRETVRAATV